MTGISPLCSQPLFARAPVSTYVPTRRAASDDPAVALYKTPRGTRLREFNPNLATVDVRPQACSPRARNIFCCLQGPMSVGCSRSQWENGTALACSLQNSANLGRSACKPPDIGKYRVTARGSGPLSTTRGSHLSIHRDHVSPTNQPTAMHGRSRRSCQ